MSDTQRYTLSLPAEVYDELRKEAEKKSASLNTVIRQCLKLGLLALKVDSDPNAELIYREWRQSGPNAELVAYDRVLMVV
jgi:hypothetical protein